MSLSSTPVLHADDVTDSSNDCDTIADTIPYYAVDGQRPRYRTREISSVRCPATRQAFTTHVFQRQYANANARISSLHAKVAVLHQHIAQLKEWVYEFTEELDSRSAFHGSDSYEQHVKLTKQHKCNIVRGTCALLLTFHDELDATNRVLKQEEQERTVLRESFALASQADCLLLQAASAALVYGIDQDDHIDASGCNDSEHAKSETPFSEPVGA